MQMRQESRSLLATRQPQRALREMLTEQGACDARSAHKLRTLCRGSEGSRLRETGVQQGGGSKGRGQGQRGAKRARLRSMNRFWFSRFLGLPDPGGARVPLAAFGATMSSRDALSFALVDWEATDVHAKTHRYNSHDHRQTSRSRHASMVRCAKRQSNNLGQHGCSASAVGSGPCTRGPSSACSQPRNRPPGASQSTTASCC